MTPRLQQELPARPASLHAAFDEMPGDAHARVRVLHDNNDAWAMRMRLLEAATTSIDVQYFIIEPDVYGLSLLGMLARKARAGVKVRVMLDARGSFSLIRGGMRPLLQELERSGVQAKVYNPILFQVADTIASGDFRGVTASNHDKLLIVDGKTTITGGRNLSRDYQASPLDHPNAFIDLDVLVDGRAAALRYTEAFSSEFASTRATDLFVEPGGADAYARLHVATEAMRAHMNALPLSDDEAATLRTNADARTGFARTLEEAVRGKLDGPLSDDVGATLHDAAMQLAALPSLRGALSRDAPPLPDDDTLLHVLDTHSTESGDTRNNVNDNIVKAVLGAQREIILQTPYLLLTERGMAAFEDASRRGVAITILTNSPVSSDNMMTQAAFKLQWPEILARAPTARLFVVNEPRVMHAKAGAMDGEIAFAGSYNLDPLSAGVNGEIVNAMWSSTLADEIGGRIRQRIATGAPTIVEYTIARDVDGNAIRKDGKPVVVVGAESHCSPGKMHEVDKLLPLVKMIEPLL